MFKATLLILILLLNVGLNSHAQYQHSISEWCMGTKFKITVICENERKAKLAFNIALTEVNRIESLISSWKKNSETSLINTNAGNKPVKVSKELFNLIKRGNKVSELSQGAFDLTFGSINNNLWHFDENMKSLPDTAISNLLTNKINYKNILLNEEASTVFLKEPDMKLGFGAIGKGYAADRVKKLLIEANITSGIVNAGGDLLAWGNQLNGEEWTIGVANPNLKEKAISYLKISNQAVVTSGNYERYAIIDGIKYSHIINPKTGLPISGIKSVTVICKNAELADALATAVYVMGPEVGLNMIEQLKGVECLIIDENNKMHNSSNIILKQ